jgi:hypothetical protein
MPFKTNSQSLAAAKSQSVSKIFNGFTNAVWLKSYRFEIIHSALMSGFRKRFQSHMQFMVQITHLFEDVERKVCIICMKTKTVWHCSWFDSHHLTADSSYDNHTV